MSNLFDPASYPIRVPAELIAGDGWAWKRPELATSYPEASYAITYEFRRLADAPASAIALAGSVVDGEWRFEATPAETVAFEPGLYAWSEFATRSSDGQRRRLDAGTAQVAPDPATAADDQRSHAQRMLDRLEKTLEALAGKSLASITVEGRTYTRRDITQLRADRNAYRAERDRELEAERLAAGGTRTTRVLTTL